MNDVLKPLGIFGTPFAGDTGLLWPLAQQLHPDLREPIARYLEQGVLIGPSWMSAIDDPLQGRASCRSPGNWMTDGIYHWRDSAAAFVREYGIGLSEEVVDHCLHEQGNFAEAQGRTRELWTELHETVLPTLSEGGNIGFARSAWREASTITAINTASLRVIGDVWGKDADTAVMRVLAQRPLPYAVHRAVAARFRRSPVVIENTRDRSDDVLHPAWTRVAPRTIRTDGKYVWREDYAHYVRLHGVAAPDDFVADAMTYQPPEITAAVLRQIRELLDSGDLARPERRWMPVSG